MNVKIKIMMIFIVLVLLSGCRAKYDLEIYNDKIIEDFEFLETNTSLLSKMYETDEYSDDSYTYKGMIDMEYSNKTPAIITNSGIYYNKKLLNDGGLGIKYNFEYSVDNYKDSSAFKDAYKYSNFSTTDELYILSTSEGNLLFEKYKFLDSIEIHLKTNHKVKNTNADKIDGYNYYWYIDNNNYNKSKIYVELYKDEYVFNYENSFLYTCLVIIGVAFLIFIVIISLIRKSRKNNEI